MVRHSQGCSRRPFFIGFFLAPLVLGTLLYHGKQSGRDKDSSACSPSAYQSSYTFASFAIRVGYPGATNSTVGSKTTCSSSLQKHAYDGDGRQPGKLEVPSVCTLAEAHSILLPSLLHTATNGHRHILGRCGVAGRYIVDCALEAEATPFSAAKGPEALLATGTAAQRRQGPGWQGQGRQGQRGTALAGVPCCITAASAFHYFLVGETRSSSAIGFAGRWLPEDVGDALCGLAQAGQSCPHSGPSAPFGGATFVKCQAAHKVPTSSNFQTGGGQKIATEAARRESCLSLQLGSAPGTACGPTQATHNREGKDACRLPGARDGPGRDHPGSCPGHCYAPDCYGRTRAVSGDIVRRQRRAYAHPGEQGQRFPADNALQTSKATTRLFSGKRKTGGEDEATSEGESAAKVAKAVTENAQKRLEDFRARALPTNGAQAVTPAPPDHAMVSTNATLADPGSAP